MNPFNAVRNMLLDCCPPDDPDSEVEESCHILAPCTHNGSCPMERHKRNFTKPGKVPYDQLQTDDKIDHGSDDGDLFDWDEDEDYIELSSSNTLISETDAFNSSFCSFVQTMPGADQRAHGEKFSYLVAQKRIRKASTSEEQLPFGDVDLPSMLRTANEASRDSDFESLQALFLEAQTIESRYLDSTDDDLGLELLRGDKKRPSFGRIVRAPIKKRGHIYIDYCASPGRIIRSRITKTKSHVTPGVFPAARKSRWGGYWPDIMDRLHNPSDSQKS